MILPRTQPDRDEAWSYFIKRANKAAGFYNKRMAITAARLPGGRWSYRIGFAIPAHDTAPH